MSETARPQPLKAATAGSGTTPLWQPLLLRAAATLAFGLVTVFWAAPGTVGLCIGIAAYFLALTATQYWTVRTLRLPRGDARRLALIAAAGLLAVSGVVVAISASAIVAAWLGGAALAVMGAAELFAALRTPKAAAEAGRGPRGDRMISGVLGLGTGILLPFFAAAGPHGLMGVAGGGAMMSGALWALSALTLRHDGGGAKGR